MNVIRSIASYASTKPARTAAPALVERAGPSRFF